jgi:hypothetical protein
MRQQKIDRSSLGHASEHHATSVGGPEDRVVGLTPVNSSYPDFVMIPGYRDPSAIGRIRAYRPVLWSTMTSDLFTRPNLSLPPPVPSGTAGQARALTTLSPLPRRWSWLVRSALWVKRRTGPDPALQRLSFIHVAHWVILDRLPGQSRRSRYTYLLFLSNFNGSWREYIDAFSIAIPGRMALLWGTAYGFPGAQPPLPFVRYIERNQLTPIHYYSAYPSSTATEIASALRVRDRFDADVRPAAGAGDAALAGRWRVFVDAVQRDL